jgi:hypothetical protein
MSMIESYATGQRAANLIGFAAFLSSPYRAT